MIEGSLFWVVAVNLVIWTGLFLFLLRIDRQTVKLQQEMDALEDKS